MGGKGALFKLSTLVVSVALMSLLSGCGSKTILDAYVLKDGYIAGDSTKGIKAVRSIAVWPLINNAQGSKAKGVTGKLNEVFIDKLYLEGGFDSVAIINEERAKELLARASEELGLKRKPKEINSGLISTKIGELTGSDTIFIGSINDYDEDKIDKETHSVVSGAFYLVDGREKAYSSLDSFTPMKYLWRTNIKQVSKETVFSGRSSIDNTARRMIDQVVQRLVKDIEDAQKEERKEIISKIAELKSKSEDQLRNEEYDKAIGTWNEVLKIDPGNPEAKAKIEEITDQKKAAEMRKEAEALKKEIAGLKGEAEALEKEGKLEEAAAKWNAILEKDKENKATQRKIENLKARIVEENERAKQKEISRLLYLAQKSFDENKFQEALQSAEKVIKLDAENEKARAIISDASAKLGEIKVKEEEIKEKIEEVEEKAAEEEPATEPGPSAEEETVKEKEVQTKEAPAAVEKEIEEPSGSDEIRSRAMEYFDNEEYQKSHDEWKNLLEIIPDDSQALEMLDTTEMLIKALQ